MAIPRTTGGLIEANFAMIDTVTDDEDMANSDKVKSISMLTNNITKVGGLELANRKFQFQAPDLARKAQAVALVHKSGDAK